LKYTFRWIREATSKTGIFLSGSVVKSERRHIDETLSEIKEKNWGAFKAAIIKFFGNLKR
jgi:hypothetical protein